MIALFGEDAGLEIKERRGVRMEKETALDQGQGFSGPFGLQQFGGRGAIIPGIAVFEMEQGGPVGEGLGRIGFFVQGDQGFTRDGVARVDRDEGFEQRDGFQIPVRHPEELAEFLPRFEVAGALGRYFFVEGQRPVGLTVAGEKIASRFLQVRTIGIKRQGFFDPLADDAEVFLVGIAVVQRVGVAGGGDERKPVGRVRGRGTQGLVDHRLGFLPVLVGEVEADEVVHRVGGTGEFGNRFPGDAQGAEFLLGGFLVVLAEEAGEREERSGVFGKLGDRFFQQGERFIQLALAGVEIDQAPVEGGLARIEFVGFEIQGKDRRIVRFLLEAAGLVIQGESGRALGGGRRKGL